MPSKKKKRTTRKTKPPKQNPQPKVVEPAPDTQYPELMSCPRSVRHLYPKPADWQDTPIRDTRREPRHTVVELRSMPYREYLLTREWYMKRHQKLVQANFRCQVCNSSSFLEVHHRTYERRGRERLADLTVLCHKCHSLFHGKVA